MAGLQYVMYFRFTDDVMCESTVWQPWYRAPSRDLQTVLLTVSPCTPHKPPLFTVSRTYFILSHMFSALWGNFALLVLRVYCFLQDSNSYLLSTRRFRPYRGADYSEVLWWACLSVSVCLQAYFQNYMYSLYLIFVHVICARGSVLLWWRGSTLCTSGLCQQARTLPTLPLTHCKKTVCPWSSLIG